MNIDLTTPAVLFPALSLLLLAYTNRFLALASVIRKLHAEHKVAPDPAYLGQIENLRWRIRLVRNMQFCGVLSLLLCTVCMFLLFCGLILPAEIVFTASLLVMIVSLVFSLVEIQSSVRALDLHLQDIERPERMGRG
jgi:Zn-dependent membrane protease YugP